MIPQLLKLSNDFSQTFSKCSLPDPVSKKTRKKIGHLARKKDMMAQSYGIKGLNGTYQARFTLKCAVAGGKAY